MKKLGLIFIFIFLTGLFSGIFFSTGLTPENNAHLSALLLAGFSDRTEGFFNVFFSMLLSNGIIMAAMAASLLSKLLCPLPPLILWYKSFAIGFCSGLLYMNAPHKAFIISLLKIFPPHIFIIPAFIISSVFFFYCSVREIRKKSRPSHEKKGLLTVTVISAALLTAGCITSSLCRLIAL